MANTSRTKPANRAKNRARSRKKQPARQTPWLWIGLIALVVVAGVIAVVASRGGGSKSTVTTAGIEETRPVEVRGTPLPPQTGDTDPAIGKPVPEVTGADFDGTPVTIGHDGRPKLIVFVAHWCPHCQREVPVLVNYVRSHPLPANVDLIAVATSTSPDRPNYPPSTWLKKERWPGKVLADSANGDAAAAYGLQSFPYFVAVDASGNLAARATGELNTDVLAQLIAKVTAPAG